MYGCIKLIMPKMDCSYCQLQGDLCDSFDFFRARLNVFFAKDSAIEGDLGVFYLTSSAVENRPVPICYQH